MNLLEPPHPLNPLWKEQRREAGRKFVKNYKVCLKENEAVKKWFSSFSKLFGCGFVRMVL